MNKDLVFVFPSVNNGTMILNYDGKIIDRKIYENLFSINGQLTKNGEFIFNSIGKQIDGIYFNDIFIMNKNREFTNEIHCDYISHECIYGSNMPRYYTPLFDYSKSNKNFLIIKCELKKKKEFSKKMLLDNVIVEMDSNGKELWRWAVSDHINEFGFSEKELKKLANVKNPFPYGYGKYGKHHDYVHLNSACTIGQNKWYDQGDERFHPDNIICSSRQFEMIFIISKKTGEVTYTLRGNEFNKPFIKQHYAHLIPNGLDGAGNILFFDKGMEKSRIVELNPITKEIVFEYQGDFYSETQSSVQKLPSGDYLIGISLEARALIVNKNKNIVKEFNDIGNFYRAVAYPSDWFVEYDYSNK